MSASTAVAAGSAYEPLARDYDAFTEHPGYAAWVAGLVAEARRHGLRGGRALDLGCGTGKSTEVLLDAGLDVVAADASPAMLRAARGRLGDRAVLIELDAAALPAIGRFDLVACLNDVANYVDDLGALLAGAARNLRPGGLLVFDLTTLSGYRSAFATTFVREAPGRLFVWRGHEDAGLAAGAAATATLEAFAEHAGAWERRTSVHRQRHHPLAEVGAALDAAGFALCTSFGQHDDGTREPRAGELSAMKAVFVARRRTSHPVTEGGR